MRLTGRLFLGVTGLLLFSILVMTGTFRSSLRRQLEQELTASLTREAEQIQRAAGPSVAAWQQSFAALGLTRANRITVYDSTGRSVFDARVPPATLSMAPFPGTPLEVQEAIAGAVGASKRTDGEVTYLFVAIPGELIVRVAANVAVLDPSLDDSWPPLTGAAVLVLLVGGGLAILGARRVAGPLARVAHAAETFDAREISALQPSPIGEIDTLVRALQRINRESREAAQTLTHDRVQASALIDVMEEGVVATDANGRTMIANPAARRLFGYPSGQTLPDVAHLLRTRGARDFVHAAQRGEVIEGREIRVGGRDLLASSRPLPTGGLLLVLHDISDLRHLEAVRRDFITNASHELKTPLTAISGFAETLLDEDADPDARRRFGEIILANAQRMQALVDHLLDLARAESAEWRPEPETIDVVRATEGVWAPLSESRPGKRIEIRHAIGPEAGTVWADPEALRQILGNLLDNAIRYTPPGGRITLATVREKGGVALRVGDTGSGIPGEQLQRIFERFYRADPARSRAEGGTGLGLAIVKHLTEAHGGWVAAESEFGRGTTISCWFPSRIT